MGEGNRALTASSVEANAARSIISTDSSVDSGCIAGLAETVQTLCPKMGKPAITLRFYGGRSRIRTYDFHRVKVALYR